MTKQIGNNQEMLKKFNVLSALFIKYQTRAMGYRVDRLMIILSAICFLNLEESTLQKAKAHLIKSVKPENLALKLFDRLNINLSEFIKDPQLYEIALKKSLDIFTQDIQLFSIAIDILENSSLDFLEDRVKRQYDTSFHMNKKSKSLLDFQEKYYL